jgi:hypothetical protein
MRDLAREILTSKRETSHLQKFEDEELTSSI